jgi:hypothetical protein
MWSECARYRRGHTAYRREISILYNRTTDRPSDRSGKFLGGLIHRPTIVSLQALETSEFLYRPFGFSLGDAIGSDPVPIDFSGRSPEEHATVR